MFFFLTLDDNAEVGFTPFEERVKAHSRVVCYLSEPLPLSIIILIIERLTKRHLFNSRSRANFKAAKNRISEIIEDTFLGMSIEWKEITRDSYIDAVSCPPGRALGHQAGTVINQSIVGKQLSIRDLQGLAREYGLKYEEILKLANDNVEHGQAQWVPSVKQFLKGWQCQRCGEKDLEEWPGFYGAAATCHSCESIGPSTSLDVLYRDLRSLSTRTGDILFQPYWDLTEAQRLASQQIHEFVKDTSEKALLWAACGAGKTEVCFSAAAWALEQGKSVLFAAPRQDVINDIAPRFERDFPNYPLQVLTGRTTNKFQLGCMVLATTHQVLRFWRSFDVIFLDEMDAFPYRGSRALEWGVNQALRQGGKLIYLTATPSPEVLRAVKQGNMLLIRLPARHHRRPLPVPIWTKYKGSLDSNEGTSFLIERIKLLRKQGPVLVFVPKISSVAPWTECFRRRFPHWHVAGSYSSDSERCKKIENLKQGQYDIFVSTTILERGITLTGVQVVVLAADHPVFDERALVQMAGRVGRTPENPGGEAIFISEHRTPSIDTAIKWIKEQNRIALELGLIHL